MSDPTDEEVFIRKFEEGDTLRDFFEAVGEYLSEYFRSSGKGSKVISIQTKRKEKYPAIELLSFEIDHGWKKS